MAARLLLAVTVAIGHVHALLKNNEASARLINDGHLVGGADMSLEAMESIFQRSFEQHQASMDEISKRMTLDQAITELDHRNMTKKAAISELARAVKVRSLRKQPSGYSGIDGARKLLNDMIYESMSKYDAEIAKCTEYYSKQCALMEECRGEIAASNYIAANSRALILDSQSTINKCEVDIPTTKLQLKQHNEKCAHELKKMNDRLKIVEGDIAVMTTILEMTDCEKAFFQIQKVKILKCKDKCNQKSFISFNHDELKDKVNALKDTAAKNLFDTSFNDIFSGIESLEGYEFIQLNSLQIPNKTEFNNPPVPRTEVPGNPCNDPDAGAPSAADKRAAKCTIKKSPQCYKLQERFLHIQGGIMDERDNLLEQIESMEGFCDDTKKSMETSISNDEDMLEQAQTKLAQATEKEANAGETARMTNAKHDSLRQDLDKQMKTCSENYINFETELCALKKIRGELYKMKGGGSGAGFFQDCELGKWEPEDCSKSCKGGVQKLTRSVLTHPDGGTKCLPLEAEKSCQNQPCPVDCVLHAWGGWSKCSAECGGGVTQRVRDVKLAMKYGGNPCGKTSESKSCNGHACEKDCELSDWTAWSECSKECDGGTNKRSKFVTHDAEGAGKCPDQWSVDRLEYRPCAQWPCYVEDPDKAKPCNKTMDVIILLDGRAGLKKEGWAEEIKAAKLLVGAFEIGKGKANIAIISYSGPRTWSGIEKCTAQNGKSADSEKDCGTHMVSHFTNDYKKLDQLLTGLEFPKGGFLTSLGLMKAKAELALGDKDAHTAIVVFSAGPPLSFKKTKEAARALRKSARLLWVPVSKFAPLEPIKKMATRRWQENVVVVENKDELGFPEIATHVIANICPEVHPELEMAMPEGALQ